MQSVPVLLLMIGVGGVIGGFLRYHVTGWVYARTGADFPWGTLAVNVLGSFVLGLLLGGLAGDPVLTPVHALVTVGVIGAFTTFSTFAYESVMLIEERQWGRSALYVAASLGLGLLSIALGLAIRLTFT